MKKQTEENHFFDDLQLKFVLGDLFFAGQETTVTTLRWGLLFLLKNPQVQERAYQEMKRVLGRMPNLNDRPNLPYMQAVVMETQRLGNIVPFGVMHATNQDTTLYGYCTAVYHPGGYKNFFSFPFYTVLSYSKDKSFKKLKRVGK